MDRQDALRKGALTYTGKACPKCWSRKRYTADRSCWHCRAYRTRRHEMTSAELQAARLKDAARKRIARARAQSAWESILAIVTDKPGAL